MQERLYKTQAVVLRRFDFGETGKQLVIYTPRLGKLSVIAHGLKRTTSKLAGHLEPLTLSSLLLARGRNLDTVTQAQIVESFSRVRTESERVFYGMLVAELLDKLTMEREENQALWDLFVGTLRRLDTEPDPWVAGAYFQVRLLDLSGYRPELNACVECGGRLSAEAVYYSPRLGGALCPECRTADAGAVRVSANAVKVLRAALITGYQDFRRIRIPPDLRGEIDSLLRLNLRRLLDLEIGSSTLLEMLNRPVSGR